MIQGTIGQRVGNVSKALRQMGETEAFNMVNEAIGNALARLPKEERRDLLAVTKGITNVRGMGQKSALELLFRLGVFLLEDDERPAEQLDESQQFSKLPEWILRGDY